MTESSVTKAADRLALTQSAVSNAVARMRVVWNDPLFTRSGRGIKPTARAQALWREVQEPLAAIRMAASPEAEIAAQSDQHLQKRNKSQCGGVPHLSLARALKIGLVEVARPRACTCALLALIDETTLPAWQEPVSP